MSYIAVDELGKGLRSGGACVDGRWGVYEMKRLLDNLCVHSVPLLRMPLHTSSRWQGNSRSSCVRPSPLVCSPRTSCRSCPWWQKMVGASQSPACHVLVCGHGLQRRYVPNVGVAGEVADGEGDVELYDETHKDYRCGSFILPRC